jgi:hypothetical protein
MGNIFQSSCRDFLTDNSSLIGYTEKNKPTQTVQHGAHRLCRLGPLPGGAFEFKPIRFPFFGEAFKLF